MKDLFSYIREALNLSTTREYVGIERDETAKKYMQIFWDELKKYVLDNGGNESRNKYRLYLPYTGPNPEVIEDNIGKTGSKNYWTNMRRHIREIVDLILDERGQWIDKWDYIGGICDVAMKDQNGNVKIRTGQKIGKLITKDKDPISGKPLVYFFANDPIRVGKNILSAIKSKNLWVVISNHAYDIAGMSTNRDWTSCMNLIDGFAKDYVKNDIKYGTLVAYIIDKNDTNIEHPYGRVLIKPYTFRHEHNYKQPIIYSPEVTVYSPYLGLRPIREWLKKICEEIQEGEGLLKMVKNLYLDTYHDDPDITFNGKRK